MRLGRPNRAVLQDYGDPYGLPIEVPKGVAYTPHIVSADTPNAKRLGQKCADLLASDLELLYDLEVRVSFVEHRIPGAEPQCALALSSRDGNAAEVYFDEVRPLAETLVDLSARVQDSAVFDDYPRPWPVCPVHPDSGHSLIAMLFRGFATWQCPVSKNIVSRVGSLREANEPHAAPVDEERN